jgi:very-short-patch-repair endonuclease
VEEYVVDFCRPEERLVVELDGSVHGQPSQVAHDALRDDQLRDLGFEVARFSYGVVLSVPEEFVHQVLSLLKGLRAARVGRGSSNL